MELHVFMWFSRDFDWIKDLSQAKHWFAMLDSILHLPLSFRTRQACLIDGEQKQSTI